MEKLNQDTLSFSLKKSLNVLILTGILLGLAACGKSGGNKGAVVGNNLYPGCVDCGAMTNPILVGQFLGENINYSGGGVYLDMSLYASSTATGVGGYPGSSYPGSYYPGTAGSSATANGVLRLTADSRDSWGTGGCLVPAGNYSLTTVQMGTYSTLGGEFTIPRLTGTGPVPLELSITGPEGIGSAFAYSNSVPKRLHARVTVLRVNGVSCAPDFYSVLN